MPNWYSLGVIVQAWRCKSLWLLGTRLRSPDGNIIKGVALLRSKARDRPNHQRLHR